MNYSSPGVEIRETDGSAYARGGNPSVGALVGVSTKGPVGRAVLVTSLPDFEETFGGPRTDSYLYHAAKGFFDNGGSVLYVVRVAHYTDVSSPATLTALKAKAELENPDDNVVLTYKAKSEGTWANGIKVRTTLETDGTITVLVMNSNSVAIEPAHRGLNLTPGSRDFIELRLANDSRYIDAVYAGTGTVPNGSTDLTLSGGDDGLDGLVDADFIGDEEAKTGIHALSDIPEIRQFAVPGRTSQAVSVAMKDYAEKRGNMVAILSTPQGLNARNAANYRKTTLGFSSSYAALYWPWVKVIDPVNGLPTSVPPVGHILGVIASSDAKANPWGAPAGLERGKIRGVIGLDYSANKAEVGVVYDAGVNAIIMHPREGIVVWGQKTMLNKPSDLDRLNVRRMFNEIKRTLAETSEYLLFEPNDAQTWSAFERFARPYLQAIKDSRGLYEFLIRCDETTNTPYYRQRNIMRAKVFLKPTKTGEFFEIDLVVTSQDAKLEELQ